MTPKRINARFTTTEELSLLAELDRLFPHAKGATILRKIFLAGAPLVVAQRREELKAQRDE